MAVRSLLQDKDKDKGKDKDKDKDKDPEELLQVCSELNAHDTEGVTALMLAARGDGGEEILKMLLAAGVAKDMVWEQAQ
jgi:hypothetical protein